MSQDPTFELIQSLSPNEKRFFRLQSGAEKNYLHVFDALDAMKEFDPEALKKKLKKKKLNISYEKNYLYNQILKSLRIYHTEASVKSRARAALDYVDVLIQKGLYEQAMRVLKKNETVFETYENFPNLIALHDYEEAILHRTDGLNTPDAGAGFYGKRTETLGKMQNLIDYRLLERQMISLHHHSQFSISREKLQKIKKHRLLLEDKSQSFDAKFRYFQVNAMIAIYEHDYKKEAMWFREIIALINAHPEIKEAYYKIYYVVALHNYINACFICNDFTEAEKVIGELKQLDEAAGYKQAELHCYALMDEASLYTQMGEPQKGAGVLTTMLETLKQTQISDYSRSLLAYATALVFFMNRQYRESAKTLQTLIDEMKNSEYKDRQAFARVVLLINYYEMGKFDMIDYILNSTQRFLKINDRYYKTEKAMLSFFKKAAMQHTVDIAEVEKLKTTLQQIFSDEEEASLLFLFDFIAWVDSKILGLPFAQVVAAQVKKLKQQGIR